jgi:predicted metalloprotease with PDZ domain
LRPEPLGPFNYQEENYTSMLWIAEGFTAYYDDLMVTRAGLGKREAYLSSVAGAINYATNSIGSKVQSVSESSFDAWIKYYRGNENSGNTTTDYYTKGSVIALYLDLLILKNSKGERSLDNVMKSMYETYYRKLNRPYSEAEFKEVLEKNVGGNLDDFFQKYIHGTEVLKLDELLLEAGFLLEEKNNLAKPYLGFNVRNSGNDRFVVYSVQEGYEAMEAGFNPNDVIVTVNGEKPNIEMFTTGTGMIIGTPIQFEILRDTRKISITATPRPNPFPTFAVTSLEKLTSVQKAIQKKWLGNK